MCIFFRSIRSQPVPGSVGVLGTEEDNVTRWEVSNIEGVGTGSTDEVKVGDVCVLWPFLFLPVVFLYT